jgi:uncharacterized protein
MNTSDQPWRSGGGDPDRPAGLGDSAYGYGGGPGPGFAVTPDERNWAVAAHLSSVLGIWIGFLGALGPLVVMLTKGKESAYVRAQAVEALNFNITVLAYSIIGWILAFVLIGFVILGVVFVFWLVLTIVASIKVSNGEHYRYPLTFRLVR